MFVLRHGKCEVEWFPKETSIAIPNGAALKFNGTGELVLATPGGGSVYPSGSSPFSEFFALMPGDNAATVGLGDFVEFPQDGETSAGGSTRSGASAGEFVLPNIGSYHIEFQVSVDEAGQLEVWLDGAQVVGTAFGRATGTSQIVGNLVIETTLVNQVLSIRNPSGNAAALTITPIAGGTESVLATLIITELAGGSGFTAGDSIAGISLRKVVASDPDYATQFAKIPVYMLISEAVFMADVGAGTATLANIGNNYDLFDAVSVDLTATGSKVVTVVDVLSPTQVLVKFNSAYEFVNI